MEGLAASAGTPSIQSAMTKQRKNHTGHCRLCGKPKCNGARGVSWRTLRALGKKRRINSHKPETDD